MPSEKELRQKAHELGLFQRFCSINPFKIDAGSIAQPLPPAPDIKVKIRCEGTVGFELVNVDDIGYLRGLNLMPESSKILADFHESLGTVERAAFDAKYRDAMLHVTSWTRRGCVEYAGRWHRSLPG